MPASDHADLPATPGRRRRISITFVVLVALLAQLFAPIVAPPPAVRAAEAAARPTTLSGSPPPATLGEPYSYRFQLDGPPQSIVTVDAGSLPLGLSLSPDGTLSGTPINGGSYGFTLWAGNERGVHTTLPVMLEVQTPAPEPEIVRDGLEEVGATAPEPANQAAIPAAMDAPQIAAPATEAAAYTSQQPSILDELVADFLRGLSLVGGVVATFFNATASAAEPPQGATPSFSGAIPLAGSLPTQVAQADFDGDGITDMAASNNGATTVTVWRNTTANGFPNPTFATPVNLTLAAGQTGNWGIVAADFSGDGKPDLALADGARQILVWTNTTPGAGQGLTFSTPTTISPSLSNPFFLASGDFNNDNKIDLAVSNYQSGAGTQIAIILNTTSPTAPTAGFGSAQSFTVPAGPVGLVATDLNDDGKDDLAIATATSLSVLINTAANGAGSASFSAPTNFTLPAAGWGIAAADLNNDLRPDLALGYNAGTANAAVFLNNTATGAATPAFFTRVDVGTGSSGYRDVALADLNSDDRVELVSRAAGPALRVFPNTTAANATTPTFSAPVELSADIGNGGIAVIDLNSDSNPDLVAPNANNSSLSLFMNQTGPLPTPTNTPTNTATATATATNTPTATVEATTTPTATPNPGGGNTRDVGLVRVWADSFVDNGGQTTATGNVGIGSISASTPYYLVGTSAVWTGSGPINLNGTIAPNGGTAFGNGPLSVNTSTGVATWQTGSQILLTKLGTSNLNLVNPSIALSVLQPQAQVTSSLDLSLPENNAQTLQVSYAIGPNDAINANQPVNFSMVLAGGNLTAQVTVGASGLSAATAQYSLPGLTALTLNNLLIDGQGEAGLRFGNGGAFPMPNIDLGFGVLILDNLQGTLAVSNNAYIINLTGGLGINGLPESPVPIRPPLQNLRIAAGAVTGEVGDLPLKFGGTTLTLKSITIQRPAGGYRLVAATATFVWPASWGTSTTQLQQVSILTQAPYIEIGGGSQNFTSPNGFPLGGANSKVKVQFDQINATVSYLAAPQNKWGLDITMRVTFTFGSDVTVVQGVNVTLVDGNVSGSIANLNLKIAGVNLLITQMAFNGSGFSAASATLTLPSVWNGASVSVSGVNITANAVQLGGVGGVFPIPDQSLGSVIKLTGMNGKVNIDPGTGAYTIGVVVGGLVFKVGSDTSTISNINFTIANGAVSALIATATVKVAGLGVTATNLAYTNGAFSVGSVNPARPGDAGLAAIPGTVTLQLPGAWKGTSISLEGLDITPNSFSLGGAGGTFPIPDQTLGKVVKLTGMTGKVNLNVNTGAYTIGITVGSLVFTAGNQTSSASNVQFTIAGGNATASIGSMTLKVAGLNVVASQINYANATFTAGSAKITFPSAWKGLSVSVSGLTITNDLISIGGAGSTFNIPNIALGSTGVLTLTQNKGSLKVDANNQYFFSVSSVVTVSKVQTTGGGSGLTVAGTLTIKNGTVSGTISALAFKVSGVDFSATNMQFVGDKLTVQQASLSLSIAGKVTKATIYGLEIGGSAGFKFQGAQIQLPDFTIGSVGVKGAMIKFVAGAGGSYTVEGAAKFVFTTFSVDGKFKIGYSPNSGVSLQSVALTFTGSLPSPAIPLGNTGFAIVKISGAFDMSSASTTISIGLGAASYAGVGSISILSLDASVTITIKPTFSLKASAGAKVIGIQVATVDLYVSPTAFQLKGTLQLAIVKASLEITFGKDASNQFTFYGKVAVEIIIPRGYFCGDDDWWCPTFPTSNVNIGSATLEGGKFKKNSDVIWGARGSATAFGFSIYAWAKFAPGGTDFGIGDKLKSYAPVKPVGVTLAADRDAYDVTVTEAAEYLMILETVAVENRAAPEDLQISGPGGVQFTKQLMYSEPDNSLRIYRLEFADPAAAVGTWSMQVQKGNIAGMIGAAPGPQLSNFSACVGATCLTPGATTELNNNETLDVNWAATAPATDMTVAVYAESATGMRYPLAQQETVKDKNLSGETQWTLGLPSGTYTMTIELESDGFAPVQLEQGVITINDTTPPAAPTGMSAVADSDMSATAAWNGAAAEADVMGYQFAVNGGDPISIDGRLSDYITYGLEPGATHSISVAAYDMSGNLGQATTVQVTAPAFGVAAAWPLRDSMNGAVTDVGVSFTGPVNVSNLTLKDGDGTVVPGRFETLIGEVTTEESVVLGAIYLSNAGGLTIGDYTAVVTATNPATGAVISYEWNFTVTEDPFKLYMPALYK